MSVPTSYFGTDLQYMIEDFPVSVTGLGSAITGTISELDTTETLMMGGGDIDFSQRLVIPANGVTLATVGKKITVNGSQKRISRISQSQDGVHITLDLANIN